MHLLAASALLWPLVAGAQASACDELKSRLAARIDPGIRVYTLEAVAADATMPPGAKVIGTCEGGARKIVFSRRAPAPGASTAGASEAPKPASAPAIAVVANEPVVAPVVPAAPAAPVASAASPATEAASAPALVASVPDAADEPLPIAWLRARWPWLAAPLVLALAGALWAWVAHRRAYDDYGLPRGPRLR